MKLRFGTALATIAHLAAYGTLGWFALAAVFVLVALSLGLLPVLAIGLLFVALLALWLRGTWLLEANRVAALFGTEVRQAPLRRSVRSDGWRVPHTLLLQFADPNNWAAVLHAFLITVLGTVTLGAVQLLATGLGMLVWPFTGTTFGILGWWVGGFWAVPVGLLAIVVALAGLFALAISHRALSLAVFARNREQELQDAARQATVRRGEAIRAAEVERARIERDLHDGLQPRLVSVGMTLGLARQQLPQNPAAAAGLIDEAHTSTKAAITELRQLARGFHPAVLEDRGLDAALSALAAQSPIPVTLDVQLLGRCAAATEAAAYFAIAEAVTNAGKHATATNVQVTVRLRPGGNLWARVEDDGLGGARRIAGGGIDGVANRVHAAGGSFTLSSPAGGPTTIEVSLPCAS